MTLASPTIAPAPSHSSPATEHKTAGRHKKTLPSSLLSPLRDFFLRFVPPQERKADDDATTCTDDDDDQESHSSSSSTTTTTTSSTTTPTASSTTTSPMTSGQRLSLLRFCVNVHQTYNLDGEGPSTAPAKDRAPITILSFPNRLGVRHPSDGRNPQTQWKSLMKIGKEEMRRKPTTALMAWNDALAIRVRNYYYHLYESLPPEEQNVNEQQREQDKQQDIAMTLNCIGIGLCLQDMERNEYMAFDAFEKSLQIRQDMQGPGHEDCAEVVHNMWIMLHERNKKQQHENDKKDEEEEEVHAKNDDDDDNNDEKDDSGNEKDSVDAQHPLDSFRGLS